MTSQLKLVRGVISNLEVHAGEEEFIRSQVQRAGGGVAAVGLAAAGMAGPAVGAAMAAAGRDSVEFFTCTVDGKPVTGRFSKASFKDGDEVEVVLEPQADGTESALAVRRPADKTLWMLPHCSRGKRTHAIFSAQVFIWIFFAIALLLYFALVLFGSRQSWIEIDWFDVSLIGVNALLVAGYFSVRFLRTWRAMADTAERVFAALGYSDPAQVDLEKDHKRACKARGEKWPYLSPGPWIYRYPEKS